MPKNQWLQFSISTALWCTAICGAFFCGMYWNDLDRGTRGTTIRMNIELGQSRAISNQTGMPELVVENPEVVVAEFKRASEFIVTAKDVGISNILAYDRKRRKTTYEITVTR